MTLSIALRQSLHAALLDAFSSYDELGLATTLYLGVSIADITPDGARPIVVMKVIQWAEARDLVTALVDAARQANPTNARLQQFTDSALAQLPVPALAGAADIGDAKVQYERIVLKSVNFAKFDKWQADAAAASHAVCRIECPVGQGQGTGFLIGPDLVMTNHHVVKDQIASGGDAWKEVACRFGYRADKTGKEVSEGTAYRLIADPLVTHSEVTALDYAVIRLSAPAGADPIDGAAAGTRGWLQALRHTFEMAEPIYLVQHPDAADIRVTVGAYVGGDNRSIQYQANSLPGSSGSPCFNANWKLVALHRGAVKTANTGTPTTAILDDLVAKAKPDVLVPATP